MLFIPTTPRAWHPWSIVIRPPSNQWMKPQLFEPDSLQLSSCDKARTLKLYKTTGCFLINLVLIWYNMEKTKAETQFDLVALHSGMSGFQFVLAWALKMRIYFSMSPFLFFMFPSLEKLAHFYNHLFIPNTTLLSNSVTEKTVSDE